MDSFFKYVVVAIAASMIALSIRKQSPEIALMICIASGVAILISSMSAIERIIRYIESLANISGISANVLKPLIKVTGISIIARISSEICKDSGEDALAAKVELMSIVAALFIAIPLLNDVLKLISSML